MTANTETNTDTNFFQVSFYVASAKNDEFFICGTFPSNMNKLVIEKDDKENTHYTFSGTYYKNNTNINEPNNIKGTITFNKETKLLSIAYNNTTLGLSWAAPTTDSKLQKKKHGYAANAGALVYKKGIFFPVSGSIKVFVSNKNPWV